MKTHLDEVLEALWLLHIAVSKIHTNAKFEVRLDKVSKKFLENEFFVSKNYNKAFTFAISLSEENQIKEVFGKKFGQIEEGG